MKRERKPKPTEFEIMMQVAELGLLKSNPVELARIDGYLKAKCGYEDAEYKITKHKILVARYIGPGQLGEYADWTFRVLLEIYGSRDHDNYYWERYEDMLYYEYLDEQEKKEEA